MKKIFYCSACGNVIASDLGHEHEASCGNCNNITTFKRVDGKEAKPSDMENYEGGH